MQNIRKKKNIFFTLSTNFWIQKFINYFIKNGKKRQREKFFSLCQLYFKLHTEYSLFRLIFFNIKCYTNFFLRHPFQKKKQIYYKRSFPSIVQQYRHSLYLIRTNLKKHKYNTFIETLVSNLLIITTTRPTTELETKTLNSYSLLYYDRKFQKNFLKKKK